MLFHFLVRISHVSSRLARLTHKIDYFLCFIDLLCTVDRLGKIDIAPVSGPFFIPVQQMAVQFLHIAVQRRDTVLLAKADPERYAGHFEGGIDQGQDMVPLPPRYPSMALQISSTQSSSPSAPLSKERW